MADLMGRSHFVRNVMVGGGVHFVAAIAGFIVPRQISDGLGQNVLGIWDLGWVTLQYISIGSLGVQSALLRWVSLHRAAGTIKELPSHITTALLWQLFVAVSALIIISIFALTIHLFIELDSAEEYQQSKYFLLMMAGGVFIHLLGTIPGSVITGCHRFYIQHSIEGFQALILSILIVVFLLNGANLVHLGALVIFTEVLGAFLRMYYAKVICPEARIVLKERDFNVGKKLLLFGIKTLALNLPRLITMQTTAILLASLAGPAALAVLSRGIALVKFMDKLVVKIANQFISMAGSYAGSQGEHETNQLVSEAGKFSFAMTIPMALGLIFFGDLLLALWMGENYANEAMMIALVLGTIIPVSSVGVINVATGLNVHGAIAKIGLLATIVPLVFTIVVVTYLGWSPLSAAVVIGVSWTVGRGVSLIYLIKRQLKIDVAEYLSNVYLLPLCCNLPLAISFYIADNMLSEQKITLFLVMSSTGVALSLILYWIYLLPKDFKVQMIQKLSRK